MGEIMFGLKKRKDISVISKQCRQYYAKEDESKSKELLEKRVIKVDKYFVEAARYCIENEQITSGRLQRKFSIGLNRADRIINQLANEKIIDFTVGNKPRNVIITEEEFELYLQQNTIQIENADRDSQTKKQVTCTDYYECMERIDLMEGHQFERFCADLLRVNGFSNVAVTQGSGDRGVDILGEKHGMKYAIQCKHYFSNVGNHAVQEVFSGKSIYNANIAVVMTNSFFTPQAEQDARKLCVELWNRSILLNMLENSDIIREENDDRELTEDEVKGVYIKMLEAYKSLGIDIEVKQVIIEKDFVKYGIKPGYGIRIKKIMECKDDICFILKVQLILEVNYEEGLIVISMPKKYFNNIQELETDLE